VGGKSGGRGSAHRTGHNLLVLVLVLVLVLLVLMLVREREWVLLLVLLVVPSVTGHWSGNPFFPAAGCL
jgi:hypothetical protein